LSAIACGRCGSFVQGDSASLGLTLCTECIERIVEDGVKGRSLPTVFGAIGGGAGLVAIPVYCMFVSSVTKDADLRFNLYANSTGLIAIGALGGAILGLIVDRIRSGKATVRPGLDGTSWVAIFEEKGLKTTKTTAGLAFLGTSSFLVAAKGGARYLVKKEDIASFRPVTEKRVELLVALEGRQLKLYLVGPRAREAAELMVSGRA
jgi:hypothetical protein